MIYEDKTVRIFVLQPPLFHSSKRGLQQITFPGVIIHYLIAWLHHIFVGTHHSMHDEVHVFGWRLVHTNHQTSAHSQKAESECSDNIQPKKLCFIITCICTPHDWPIIVSNLKFVTWIGLMSASVTVDRVVVKATSPGIITSPDHSVTTLLDT